MDLNTFDTIKRYIIHILKYSYLYIKNDHNSYKTYVFNQNLQYSTNVLWPNVMKRLNNIVKC